MDYFLILIVMMRFEWFHFVFLSVRALQFSPFKYIVHNKFRHDLLFRYIYRWMEVFLSSWWTRLICLDSNVLNVQMMFYFSPFSSSLGQFDLLNFPASSNISHILTMHCLTSIGYVENDVYPATWPFSNLLFDVIVLYLGKQTHCNMMSKFHAESWTQWTGIFKFSLAHSPGKLLYMWKYFMILRLPAAVASFHTFLYLTWGNIPCNFFKYLFGLLVFWIKSLVCPSDV